MVTDQFIAAFIMFSVTAVFTILFFLPATLFPQKNKTIQFYWAGVWAFLALITALAGGSNTLMLLGVDTYAASNVILTGVIAAFVVFVAFAWARLSTAAIVRFVRMVRSALVTRPSS